MARNLPTTEKNHSPAEVQATNQLADAVRAQQLAQGQAQTLSAMPVREVNVDAHKLAELHSAPVVRSALDAPPMQFMGPTSMANATMQGTPDEEVPKPRIYRVEEERNILDRTSGSRTKLRAGKEITDVQYDIRDLQRQGAKLRDITDVDPNAVL